MGKGALRNQKPCLCGALRKFKDCCWGLTDEQIQNKAKGKIITEVAKQANIKTCLYPDTTQCSEKIIRAHGLQNNKILTKLSENGEVYMIEAVFNKDGKQLKLQKQGRKEATTFTGFCGKHDKEAFAPIEDLDYEPGDAKQEALFAFRALAKEWHAKLKSKNMFDDILKTHRDEYVLAFYEGITLALGDIEKEMQAFQDALLSEESDKISTKLITLDGEADFAVSACITLSHDFNGARLGHFTPHPWLTPDQLFVTIFPQNGKTYCLLSHDATALATFAFLDEQLLNKDPAEQKQLLSRLVVRHSENVVYSPRYVEALSEQQRNLLEEKVVEAVVFPADEPLLDKELGFSLFA